jgi:hypothetical protein
LAASVRHVELNCHEQALWTVEEGRSDLELRADVRWRNGEYRVELSDVLVP